MKNFLQISLCCSFLIPALGHLASAEKRTSTKSTPTAENSDALLRGVGTKTKSQRFKPADKSDSRSVQGAIGRGQMNLSVSEGKRTKRAPTEDKVSAAATTRSQLLAKQKTSPHDAALAAMKAEAKRISPKGKGRIRISYTIGLKGNPQNVMVMGYSNKVDDAMATILEGWQMPKKLAGQMISTRVDMVPTSSKKRIAKKKTKKRGKRRVASK